MKVVCVVLLAVFAAASAFPYYHGHGVYPYMYAHAHPHVHAHPAMVPVKYSGYPYIRDASGNTVPFYNGGQDENLDGLPDVQDTNRDAKVDPAAQYTGYAYGMVLH